jgi:hypothetical protein
VFFDDAKVADYEGADAIKSSDEVLFLYEICFGGRFGDKPARKDVWKVGQKAYFCSERTNQSLIK